jgi:hypothetical protein
MYRSYVQTITLPLTIPFLPQLKSDIAHYETEQRSFWIDMMNGNMKEGVARLRYLSRFFLELSSHFHTLARFYMRNGEMNRLENNTMRQLRKGVHFGRVTGGNIGKRYLEFVERQAIFGLDVHCESVAADTEPRHAKQAAAVQRNLKKFLERRCHFAIILATFFLSSRFCFELHISAFVSPICFA